MVQALVWLLLLPVMAGLWVWGDAATTNANDRLLGAVGADPARCLSPVFTSLSP